MKFSNINIFIVTKTILCLLSYFSRSSKLSKNSTNMLFKAIRSSKKNETNEIQTFSRDASDKRYFNMAENDGECPRDLKKIITEISFRS